MVDYAELVPGTAAVVSELRDRGFKIGSTTGYTREIMAPVLPIAAKQGCALDNLVCAEDLWTGRPTALCTWKCFLGLEIDDAAAMVKVDDTVADLPAVLEDIERRLQAGERPQAR